MKIIDELRGEPILLAHHPLCGRFEDHFLVWRGRRLCRGCFTVYPTAAAVLLAMWALGAGFLASFVLGVTLFAIQLLRALPSLRPLVIAFNLILGASLASVLMAVITCPPQLRWYVYPFVLAVYVTFVYLKGRRVLRACRDCPDYASFPGCARGSARNGR